MGHYLVLAVSAFGISVLATPAARWLGVRIDAVDQPGGRRINLQALPRTGGLAIFLGALTVFMLSAPHTRANMGIALGAALTFLIGFLDDLCGLRASVKLVAQIGVSLVLVGHGVVIRCLSDLRGGFFEIGLWGVPLTVLWVVGMMNMINLIDGVDGLAAGISIIASVALFFVALAKGQALAAAMCCIVAGSAAGFLVFNFNPASVIMGDGGALLLGFLMAVISVQGALKSATAVALTVPLLALGVPFFDTLLAVVRRVSSGQRVFGADRHHLHHQMLDLGLTQRQTVLILYLASGLLGTIAILVSLSKLPIGSAMLSLFLLIGFCGGHRLAGTTLIRFKR